jgi:hypothetical protein
MVNNKRGILKNKGGWIEIFEAVVAVLLVTGFILVIMNKGYLQKSDISEKVYQSEVSILREIETNDTLRTAIINAPEPPVDWNDAGFPVQVKNKIISRTPNYLNCTGKICFMNSSCNLGEDNKKDIYTQAVVVSATLQEVDYRKLNMFCWAK